MSVLEKKSQEAIDAMIKVGREFHARGWVPGSGGNFSVRLAPDDIVMTVSGRHKGMLKIGDFLHVNRLCEPLPINMHKKPSAEGFLHTQIYARNPKIGAVLHFHSPYATAWSMRALKQGVPILRVQGYELLKVFEGFTTHEATLNVPIFSNDQNMVRLAQLIQTHMDMTETGQTYLLAGHGAYVWADNLEQAFWKAEALEAILHYLFLLD